YQTVFARSPGSVAAPTAGLHLTVAAREVLKARGVGWACVTLHVGLGTFRPVEVDNLDEHLMHEERVVVGPELAAAIAETRAAGGKVMAVGTTVVRALESARDPNRSGHVVPWEGKTRLLIQPGYSFGVVDGLLTNFHQPRSTLLALVGAFAGMRQIHDAYRAALDAGYRFLSYGDAMWIPERAC
ncbi:MAG: S-adenosylmethionine:tRNA ribosyltransferase-isomerase, partial [Polyangiaceae bacterium]|nr:S-adenosylmethionine:tRNA ribosyltransferase-isomerase [Polyangiaceae bacterium]